MPETKSRRTRACDYCRTKKIKCDAVKGSKEPCSLCVADGARCTFIAISKRAGPTSTYVAKLEERLQQMQTLLEKHASKAEISRALGFTIGNEDDYSPNSPQASASIPLQESLPPEIRPSPSMAGDHLDKWYQMVPEEPNTDGDDDELGLSSGFSALSLGGPKARFHGKSSVFNLLRTAYDLKQTYDDSTPSIMARLHMWDQSEWSEGFYETIASKSIPYTLPPPDELRLLVNVFLKKLIAMFPVIHPVAVKAQYSDNLHERDVNFSRLLLMICAVGSILIDDDRFTQNVRGVPVAGYQFYSQVKGWNPLLADACLSNVQTCYLIAIYHHFLGDPYGSWIYAGVGVRAAQDVGAHRRSGLHTKSVFETEQWKRTLWCVLLFERMTSAILGRTSAIQEEDFDMDPPTPIPEDGDNKPNIEFFAYWLKQAMFTGFILRTLYNVRPNIVSSLGPDWEKQLVSGLEMRLNGWILSIPRHLCWDPDRMDSVCLDQSAKIYGSYYYMTMMMHRKGMMDPKSSKSSRSDSEAIICTRAARSCTSILSTLAQRCHFVAPPALHICFCAAVVLLIAVWSRRNESPHESADELVDDLQRCVHVFRRSMRPWNRSTTGNYIDSLREIATQHNLSFPFLDQIETPSTEGYQSSTTEPNSTPVGTDIILASLPPKDQFPDSMLDTSGFESWEEYLSQLNLPLEDIEFTDVPLSTPWAQGLL